MSASISKISDSMEFNTLPVIIGVVLVIFVFVLLKNFFKSKGTNVIIVGIENSGKTAAFAQLVAGKEVQTFTSVQENKYVLNQQQNLTIIDIPGNSRLRNEMLQKYSKGVNCVVLCIDSANFVDKVRENAEVLFEVLTNEDVRKSKCPILLFCNKQDSELARGAAAIKLALERELTTLNQTAANYLAAESGGGQQTLGSSDEVISFDKLPHVITSVPGCCVGTERDISELSTWISQL